MGRFLDPLINSERTIVRDVRSLLSNERRALTDPAAFAKAGQHNPLAAPARTLSVTPLTDGVDNLRIVAAAGVNTVLTVTGFIRTPDNQLALIGPSGQGFTLNVVGDRVARAFDCGLSANIEIVSVMVQTSVSSSLVYAMIQTVRRMPDRSIVVTSTRAGDYLTTSRPLSVPGSLFKSCTDAEPSVRTIVGTNPAVATDISEAVPTNTRWELLSGRAIYTNDGTAVATQTRIRFQDASANIFYDLWSVAGGAATTTNAVVFGQNINVEALVTSGGVNYVAVTIPPNRLLAGARFLLILSDAGNTHFDFAAPVYNVREWLDF